MASPGHIELYAASDNKVSGLSSLHVETGPVNTHQCVGGIVWVAAN